LAREISTPVEGYLGKVSAISGAKSMNFRSLSQKWSRTSRKRESRRGKNVSEKNTNFKRGNVWN